MKKPIETWQAVVSEPSFGLDVLRIYLGGALFVRGALFIAHPERVIDLSPHADWFTSLLVAHYVGAAHLCGGLLLAMGLATRIAAGVQVPILAGAVFFVHWRDGLLSAGQSLELAGLVLAMLVVYMVFGAGPLSFDQRIRAGNGLRFGETLRHARGRVRRHDREIASGHVQT